MVTIYMNKSHNSPIPNPSPKKGREFEQRKLENMSCKEHAFITCRIKSPPFGGLGGGPKRCIWSFHAIWQIQWIRKRCVHTV